MPENPIEQASQQAVEPEPVVHGAAVPGSPCGSATLQTSPSSGGAGQGRRRARIGVLLDECFAATDERSLRALENAGAELVPLSALEGGAPERLDGLWLGDGAVPSYSAALSAQVEFRAFIAGCLAAGVPTIASGGGLVYLTRGLRSAGGGYHSLVGALDASAVVVPRPLPGGPIEVETQVDTLLGPAGVTLLGHVDRSWLIRGIPMAERGIYRTVSGPVDEGCGRQAFLGAGFRIHLWACPGAAECFVGRCTLVAAAKERIQGAGPRPADALPPETP